MNKRVLVLFLSVCLLSKWDGNLKSLRATRIELRMRLQGSEKPDNLPFKHTCSSNYNSTFYGLCCFIQLQWCLGILLLWHKSILVYVLF